MSKLKRTSVDI